MTANRIASIALLGSVLASAGALAVPAIDSVSPTAQRVHERIVLRGSGFGTYQPGVSQVTFTAAGGGAVTAGGVPYVWRDDYISIRVPAGGTNGPVSLGGVQVSVTMADGTSAPVAAEIISAGGATFDLFEKTRLDDDFDVSGFLGDGNFNTARTKDADVADINGDGYPDIIDNNSNNQGNGTHEVLRINRLGLFFTPINFEPVNAADTDGPFVTTVLPGGNFVGDAVSYDADFIDLNNDDLPDWVQAASQANTFVRVVMNNFNGVPGRFVEDSNNWFPNPDFPSGSPDDIGHWDVNFDGFVDVLAAFRFSTRGQVYINGGGTTFSNTITASAPSGSMHDAFFTDFNDDGFPDVVLVNESGDAALFRHNGQLPVPNFVFNGFLDATGFAGSAGDFNADGLDDIIIVGSFSSVVFINNPLAPGNFTRRVLPGAEQFTYDVELADIDLDGDIDAIGTSVVTNPNDNIRVWVNDGTGNFTNATDPGTGVVFPDNGAYQRMSADVIDMDLDGDLDIYITGADGTGVFGFGAVANQFWENRSLGLSLNPTGNCPGIVNFDGTGATPGARVILLRSDGLRPRVLPAASPCPGLPLGLEGINVLNVFTADGSGNFGGDLNVPAPNCGSFVQAVELASCRGTSVDSLP
ncbi:MAG: VCBS repeat-containing protein [Pseudomonadota bacterium]